MLEGPGSASSPSHGRREMITMMVDTLPVFYYEKLVGYMPSSFADLVFVEERIEVGLKRGKFDYVSSTGTNARKQSNWGKEEGRRNPSNHFNACMDQAVADLPRYPPICATSPELLSSRQGLLQLSTRTT